MSLSMGAYFPMYLAVNAANSAGILIVAAAGNENKDAEDTYPCA